GGEGCGEDRPDGDDHASTPPCPHPDEESGPGNGEETDDSELDEEVDRPDGSRHSARPRLQLEVRSAQPGFSLRYPPPRGDDGEEPRQDKRLLDALAPRPSGLRRDEYRERRQKEREKADLAVHRDLDRGEQRDPPYP